VSDRKITVNSKEYDLDCLDEASVNYVTMITEVKKEINLLYKKIKVLDASLKTFAQELSEHLGDQPPRKKQITEPEQGS